MNTLDSQPFCRISFSGITSRSHGLAARSATMPTAAAHNLCRRRSSFPGLSLLDSTAHSLIDRICGVLRDARKIIQQSLQAIILTLVVRRRLAPGLESRPLSFTTIGRPQARVPSLPRRSENLYPRPNSSVPLDPPKEMPVGSRHVFFQSTQRHPKTIRNILFASYSQGDTARKSYECDQAVRQAPQSIARMPACLIRRAPGVIPRPLHASHRHS